MRNWPPGEVNIFGNENMIFRNSSAVCDIQAVISISEHATEFYNTKLGCSSQHLTALQQPDNVGFKSCEEIRLEISLRFSHNGICRLKESLAEIAPLVFVEGCIKAQSTIEVEYWEI